MTDLDKLKALLDSFGVGYETEANGDLPQSGKILRCETGMTRVDGYTFFFTAFEFDHAGKFIKMGAWEA